MDRNSAIGLTLIAALITIYIIWFSPTPQPPAPVPPANDSTRVTTDSAVIKPEVVVPSDSALAATYGNLSAAFTGQESLTEIETGDLKISFTNHGGSIRELELKNFKTYQGKPLKLVHPSTSSFKLLSTVKGKEVDLYGLYYQSEQQKKGDTTVLTYTLKLEDGTSLSQIYQIPPKGFEIKYSIVSKGFETNLGSDALEFNWTSTLLPTEKSIEDTRNNSTITYYLPDEGFEKLSETSSGTEKEVISQPLKWIAIKEKFFLAALVAEKSFTGGELETINNPADTGIVKRAVVKLNIPKKDLMAGAEFTYYLGPNDYKITNKVTEGFAKNVYLGWPPVYWINKFVIFPVFHFLTQHIANYGVIIIILVFLLKLVLFPLSYKSYLSMAKMKVLKPELDEIKAKNGDDMQKTQQDSLKLYQQVGVNPISGCIPVLLQMPILFAMFYLFPASIELRQQPFLWAEDLSTYDSLIHLPFSIPFAGDHLSLFTLLMTAATLIQTWQNNQLSSVQGPMKAMSYIMPLIFFFVLNSFSAGLTFYYLVSTLVTFSQQALIRRFVDEDKIRAVLEENRKKNLSGTAKKSKFMTKLEEAMKVSQENRKAIEEAKKKKKK
jgi:YidC/Oxa1 family membrane protein insertase